MKLTKPLGGIQQVGALKTAAKSVTVFATDCFTCDH